MNEPDPPIIRRQGRPGRAPAPPPRRGPNPPRRSPEPPPIPPPHQRPPGSHRAPPGPPAQRFTAPRPDDPTRRVSAPAAPQGAQAWSQVPEAPRRSGHRRDEPAHRTRPDEPRYAPTQRPEPVPGDRPHHAEPPGGGGRGRFGRRAATSPPRRPRGRRPLRIGRILLVLLLVIVVAAVGMVFYYDNKLHRVDALASYPGRTGDTPGSNWLIVGTDSRADLSDEQRTDLSTGDADGSRTDTIMLVHKPPSGQAMIISIPRDLYVNVPGQGQHKVNAAFNIGGPQLLVQTVENLTGVRIDHFAEIGFGGFDTLVDAVGGVNICLDQPLRDPKAGLNLRKGCHTLNGRQALGLVRTRAFPNADLQRVVNQRKFLSALVSRATSPGVLLNPFRLTKFIDGAVGALTVDERDHLWHLMSLAWALRDPITTTTPTDGSEVTGDGDSLIAGERTEKFFEYLRVGQPVPKDLLDDNGGVIG